MNIFDAHCDTLYEVTYSGKNLYENDLNIDLKRISNYGAYTQFFAAWIENENNAMKKFIEMSDKFNKETEKNCGTAVKCLSYNDMIKAHKQNKCAAFLTLEGAYMVERENDIDFLYEKGVRCATLTWNGSNRLAGGVDGEDGLSDLGARVVERMQKLGILTDLSHLNERSFWDVIKVSKKPLIASHSNSRSLCSHKRNLTDEQFIAICKTGGCVGINFYDSFLSDTPGADIDDLVLHIKHFIELGGEDHIGFGSDFDGVEKLPEGISGVSDMEKIVERLQMSGLSSEQTEKIAHLNFERVVRETIG